MPKFKAINGDIIEVSEQHADQVLRKQGQYKEVHTSEPQSVANKEPVVAKKKTKKKGKKRGSEV